MKAVCEELFDPGIVSNRTTQLFEERYRNRNVRWTGTLTRVRSYRSDLVFGNEPGTKATFEIHESGGQYGGGTVQAIVSLPVQAEATLEGKTGERLTFDGTLASCDGLMRNLYVRKGSLAGEAETADN